MGEKPWKLIKRSPSPIDNLFGRHIMTALLDPDAYTLDIVCGALQDDIDQANTEALPLGELY